MARRRTEVRDHALVNGRMKAADDGHAGVAHHPGERVGFQNHIAGAFLRTDQGSFPAAKQAFLADAIGSACQGFYALRLACFGIVT
jgi:hypothetical protein